MEILTKDVEKLAGVRPGPSPREKTWISSEFAGRHSSAVGADARGLSAITVIQALLAMSA